MNRFLMTLAALLVVSGALLPLAACVDTDGDGIPDSPPGVGDDDGVAGDDDDVAMVTLSLAVSTGSCEVELFGADLQVAVSLPEVRSDLEWETPVPPRVTVPVDGNWWRVEVYAVGYTMAETFVRMIGSDAYQSETPEGGEESVVTSVTVPMHYNFSALCGDAQEYGNESCNPSAGGNRWTVYAANQENTSSVSMGSYSPIDQEVVGLALGEEIVVNGCTVSGLSAGTFEVDVTVDPNAHEFSGVVGPFTATGWRE